VSESIRRTAVVGAGTMGHGIAQVLAMAGCPVSLFDEKPALAEVAREKIRADLETGVARGKVAPAAMEEALSRLTPHPTLEEAVADADLVIEAIPEDLTLKAELFRRLDALCRPDALLASNTSCLSLTRIAAVTAHPERVLGLHFFNPPPRMKLLEVVRGAATSEATISRALALARRIGKEPILVKDSPGFATSRLGVILGLEAMRMVEEGVASPEDIDRALELGYGHPMGPLRVSDLVGLDVRLSIARSLHRELGAERFRPPRILEEKVEAGKLGKKTGEGFHLWRPD